MGCDDGNAVTTDGCNNGVINSPHWYCPYTYPEGLKDVCPESCGDGLGYGYYGCDDGNNIPFDGCSPTCAVYNGYKCNVGTQAAPSVAGGCAEYCGSSYNWHTLAN